MNPQNLPIFLKWAGGKSRLIGQYKHLFPQKINRYFEPFLGSGAVFFFIKKKYNPKEIILSDKNEELINCFEVVRDNAELLMESLKNHKRLNSKEYFYETRKQQPQGLNKIERASRFIYLNKTCFNGLYRVNSDNQFNVPFGDYKNPSILNEKLFYEASKFLKGTAIKSMAFEKILDLCKKGDFIYFDPPYLPISKTSSFTSYTNGTFLENEQINLADIFKKLDAKGCLLMLSNSDHPFIRELYKGYDMQTVKARRVISCIGSRREVVNEIVVRNYNHTTIKNFVKS